MPILTESQVVLKYSFWKFYIGIGWSKFPSRQFLALYDHSFCKKYACLFQRESTWTRLHIINEPYLNLVLITCEKNSFTLRNILEGKRMQWVSYFDFDLGAMDSV